MLSVSRPSTDEVGMSKNDAAILMGTSLISPMFNQDRWDYAYTWRRGTSPNIIRHLTLFFSNDRLVKIDKDVSARKPT